jgi:hypothetical protein
MLTIWQTVAFAKEQLQVTTFSNPFTCTEDVFQLLCPLHGSTLKSQSFFPSVLPMSFITCTVYIHSKPTYIHYNNVAFATIY